MSADTNTNAVDLDPFSGSQQEEERNDEYQVGKVQARFKREQRELYEMAMLIEGNLEKKSLSILVGMQRRFFRVIGNGAYLAYYESKPKFGETTTPNGVYTIKDMSELKRMSRAC